MLSDENHPLADGASVATTKESRSSEEPIGEVSEQQALDVLIVSQPVKAGVAVCVRQLTEAAVAAGHRVTVACPGDEHGPLAKWVKDAGARHVDVNMARQPTFRDIRDLWSIRRLCRGRDLVHLHSSKAGALGRIAVATLGGERPPVVFTPHYWSWLVGGPLSVLYRWIERILARSSDSIVAVSEQEAAEGRSVLRSAASRIVVIRNGVDLEHFSPKGHSASRDESPLLVLVGRLCRQKGQDIAIRALAGLQNRQVRLRLVGAESEKGEQRRLQALAESLGVASRIEWRGDTADVAPDLRAADVVLAPSRWEGMSLVFLEALACGVPMIVSDVSGSDVVKDSGIVVPTEDVDALIAATDELLADEPRRRRLARLATELSQNHSIEETARNNLELWRAVAGTSRRARIS